MQYKAQIFWINPSEERSYWGVYNDMIEDWRSLLWIRNPALWSIGFWLRIDHQQQDSQVIDWDGLFIQESQWGRTYCGETPQYEQHWNVKSIWKQSGCWLRKIVWTMMKDKKESFMNRNPSEERPTVDKGQNSWMIDWDVLFGNNQAADWERLFDMMDDQKESFMDKDMPWESTPVYMVQGSQNTEWGRLFKGSDCWLRLNSSIRQWHGMSRVWNPMRKGPLWIFEKDVLWGNPLSINGIGCWEYSIIKWHQICQEYEICYQWHGMLRVQNPVRKDPLWIFEQDILWETPQYKRH